MISRLMLSVRKAAVDGEGWGSYTRPFIFTSSGNDLDSTVEFASDTVSPTEAETINLELGHLPRRSR